MKIASDIGARELFGMARNAKKFEFGYEGLLPKLEGLAPDVIRKETDIKVVELWMHDYYADDEAFRRYMVPVSIRFCATLRKRELENEEYVKLTDKKATLPSLAHLIESGRVPVFLRHKIEALFFKKLRECKDYNILLKVRECFRPPREKMAIPALYTEIIEPFLEEVLLRIYELFLDNPPENDALKRKVEEAIEKSEWIDRNL